MENHSTHATKQETAKQSSPSSHSLRQKETVTKNNAFKPDESVPKAAIGEIVLTVPPEVTQTYEVSGIWISI